jgi:hypothetical protein
VWAAELRRHLGLAGPLAAAALAERLQANHPGLTAEQVEQELLAHHPLAWLVEVTGCWSTSARCRPRSRPRRGVAA